MLTYLQYRLLKALFPGEPHQCSGDAYKDKSKLDFLPRKDLFDAVIGRTVIDYGCGEGNEAIELAKLGARKVIGLDIREELLEIARTRAREAGVNHNCEFVTWTDVSADLILSIDAFEHFSDPEEVLQSMNRMLKPGGEVLVFFGPPWYHPYGGHLFSVFPWAHLVFSEKALIRWRSDFKSDGATRFGEVAGGLNQMSIRRFEQLLEESPFLPKKIELVPIRRLARIHNRWTREFATAVVRCQMVRRIERDTDVPRNLR